jgi:hypothetical protein
MDRREPHRRERPGIGGRVHRQLDARDLAPGDAAVTARRGARDRGPQAVVSLRIAETVACRVKPERAAGIDGEALGHEAGDDRAPARAAVGGPEGAAAHRAIARCCVQDAGSRGVRRDVVNLMGFDLIEEATEISALTNCGGPCLRHDRDARQHVGRKVLGGAEGVTNSDHHQPPGGERAQQRRQAPRHLRHALARQPAAAVSDHRRAGEIQGLAEVRLGQRVVDRQHPFERGVALTQGVIPVRGGNGHQGVAIAKACCDKGSKVELPPAPAGTADGGRAVGPFGTLGRRPLHFSSVGLEAVGVRHQEKAAPGQAR